MIKNFRYKIQKFIKGLKRYKIETIERFLIIENECKMNAWVHCMGALRFFIPFHTSLKTRFII